MDENKRPVFKINIDTQAIYDRLEKMEVNGEVSYAELSKLINRDVQADARSNLISARRMLIRDKRMVFDVIVGIGLIRMADPEIAGSGGRSIERIRRETRRGAQRLGCVKEFDKLPNELKIKHNAMVSIFGAMSLMTRQPNIKKVESNMQETQEKIGARKTLELFMK